MDPAVQYSVQERIKIVEAYFATKSLIQTQRQFSRGFPGRNAPTRVTVLYLLNTFKETGSVQDKNKGYSGQPMTGRTDPQHRQCEINFGNVPKENQKTFVTVD